ncbi:MAG TPA: hypothetical protein VHC00_03775 [Rhizobiaceae bacterium]|nr:hypothetical protein [Rhizobiaceae bacterium]
MDWLSPVLGIAALVAAFGVLPGDCRRRMAETLRSTMAQIARYGR